MFLNFIHDSRTAHSLCRQRFKTSYLLMPHSINKFQSLEFKENILKAVIHTVSNIVCSGTLALCVHFKITLSFD